MLDKEFAELRRLFKPERSPITHFYGCYVDAESKIISDFVLPASVLGEETEEKYLGMLKKGISGKVGKTLWCVDFPTKDVTDAPAYQLLSTVLQDGFERSEDAAQARTELYHKIIESRPCDKGYVILIAKLAYDVPVKHRDGAGFDSDTVHTFMVCAICPVSDRKPDMHYDTKERYFRIEGFDLVLKAPNFGFMFPAFDDRATNLYGAAYYAKKKQDVGEDLYQALFGLISPSSIDAQYAGLCQAIEDAYDGKPELDVVQAFGAAMREKLEQQKEKNDPAPLMVSGSDVAAILEECGANKKVTEKIEKNFGNTFGNDAELPAGNLVPTKKATYATEFMKLVVDVENEAQISLREMGGRTCLIIDIDGYSLTANGVTI